MLWSQTAPNESQDPADWVPPMTVRIYPISKPRTKLLATCQRQYCQELRRPGVPYL